MVVDAYMAQHPGDGSDRRDRQSVFVHLVGLCAVLELGLPSSHVTKLLGRVIRSRHGQFPILERTEGPEAVTVTDIVGATDLADYEQRAYEWGKVVWGSWSVQHELIRAELGANQRLSG